MWWLERADLLKRDPSSSHQLGTYPRTANLWLKDRLHDKEVRRQYRKPLEFTLTPVRRPDINPLRPDLKLPLEEVKPYADEEPIERFEIPSSWRDRLKEPHGDGKKYRLEKEEVIIVPEKKLSAAEMDQILLEEEGFVAKKKTQWRDVLASLASKGRPESRGTATTWISKALVSKPPGRAEGLRAPVSQIGATLNKKATKLRLWHEQVSSGDGLPVTGILLRQTRDPSTFSGLELCQPVSSFLRVNIPAEFGAPRRISPEEQTTALEKGGHGAFKDAIVDKIVLLESLRRQNDPKQMKREASALLCLGVLYDNGEDCTQAVANYKAYAEICKKMGDTKGEAMGYNFVACSVQEDEDKKLKGFDMNVGPMGELELPTSAALQYEQALEYHEKHANCADLEGKYMAYTNMGLLLSALGSWTEAARCHRKALKCATYLRRPEYQGVAVGNLAYLLLRRKKFGAARLCSKRYLQICETLRYAQGEARAHYMLGHTFSHLKKYSEAAEEFRNAMKIAKANGDTEMENMSKMLIGVVKGKMEYSRIRMDDVACA